MEIVKKENLQRTVLKNGSLKKVRKGLNFLCEFISLESALLRFDFVKEKMKNTRF